MAIYFRGPRDGIDIGMVFGGMVLGVMGVFGVIGIPGGCGGVWVGGPFRVAMLVSPGV